MFVTLLAISALGTAAFSAPADVKLPSSLANTLRLFGHRNWIVITDSAYPLQSNPGIETILADGDQLAVTKQVLDLLATSKHVKPIIYTDAELNFVAEQNAPGIGKYRDTLTKLLNGRQTQTLPHEQIITKLDDAGKTFKILIIKTNGILPYTSVFLQLDCAYWNANSEKQLRDSMQNK